MKMTRIVIGMEMANHVFAGLLRQNPALPLRAFSRAAAQAKMLAAAMLLRTLLKADSFRRLLATEAIDKRTLYTIADYPCSRLLHLRVGSRSKHARDAGGFYGRAMRAAIEFEFGFGGENPTEAKKSGRILISAFPQTWNAIVFGAYNYTLEEKAENCVEEFDAAIRAEWELTEETEEFEQDDEDLLGYEELERLRNS